MKSMVKRFGIIIVTLLMCAAGTHAGNITRTWHNESLSNVLRDIDKAYTDGNINFIFNELEDYTVTTAIIDKPISEALYEVIGFYPIRVTLNGNDYYVECFRKERNKLKGRLIDEHFQPVEFANVTLFNPADTTFITGGVSNSNGDFVIPTDAERIMLKVNRIGYMPFTGVYETGNVGTIRIHTEAKLLKEVQVEKELVSFDGDKYTSYPTITQINHSVNLLALLAQQPFPGMFVNERDRSIRVYNGAPIILVDGVIRNAEYLISIEAKDISRFEYSPIVPIKYLDSGASGIIYIYLKQPKDGGTFYADVEGCLHTGFINADAGASYNQGKSEFTIDYRANHRNYDDIVYRSYQSYIGSDFRVDVSENDTASTLNYTVHQLNFGYNYRHDKTSFFSVRFNNSISPQQTSAAGLITDTYHGDYTMSSGIKEEFYAPSFDLYARKEWDGGHTLEVQVTGAVSQKDYERNLHYEYNNSSCQSYRTEIDSRQRSLISAISYEKLFSENTLLQVGYQNELVSSTNDYALDDYKTSLDRTNNWLYTGLTQRIGKSSLSFGTGLKNISMKNETNRRDFTRNLSSISIGIPFNDRFSMNVYGSYTPTMPSLSQLTAIELDRSNFLITTGNPDLKIEHKIKSSVRGNFNYRKLNLSLNVEYVHLIDPMYQDVSYIGNKSFLSRTDNYNSYDRFETDLHIALQGLFNNHLSILLNSGYKYITTETDAHTVRLNTFFTYLRIMAYLGKWDISLSHYIPNKYLDCETVYKNENWSSLSVGFKPNRNWYFSISGCLLFYPDGTEYPYWKKSEVNPGYVYKSIRDNGNMILLSARYNISFGRIFGKTKRSLNNTNPNNAVMKVD